MALANGDRHIREIRPPEGQLLVAMLAARFGSSLAPPTVRVEPGRFLALVRQHRVARLLGTIPSAALPAAELQVGLDALKRSTGLHTLALRAETLRLVDALRAERIETVVLKGVAFAHQFHEDAATRPARDIDLLVRPQDLPAARSVLERLGYTSPPIRPGGFDEALAFRSNDARLLVELHRALHEFPEVLASVPIWGGGLIDEVALSGGKISVLRPDFALVYASVHGAKHFWRRLLWLSDIAAAATSGRIDLGSAWELALRYRCEHYLALALALVERTFALELSNWPPAQERTIEQSRRHAAWLAPSIAMSPANSDQDAMHRIGGLRSLMLLVRLSSGWRARSGTIVRILRPTEDDKAVVRLPRALGWAYFPLRLARLASNYSFRAGR